MYNNINKVNSINKGGDVMYGIQVRIGGLYLRTIENAGSKPYGGIWTASLLEEEMGSSWTEWCEKEEFNLPEDGMWKAYLLQPNANARIYSIDSIDDYYILLNKYKSYDSIDYEAASKDYDAIHLTWDGINDTHDDLYGWDMESTVWLNEAYTVIEEITWPVVDRNVEIVDYRAREEVIKHVPLKKGKGTYRWKYKITGFRPYFYTSKLFALRYHKRVFGCMKVCIRDSECALKAIEASMDVLEQYWSRDEQWSMRFHARVEDFYGKWGEDA